MRSHAKALSVGPISGMGNAIRLVLLAATAALSVSLLAAPPAWANGNVNVTVTGAGSGTVTGASATTFDGAPVGPATATPGEIDCDKSGGPICSATVTGFIANTMVTLTATPAPDSSFAGWTQSGATVSQRCTTPPQEANPTCAIHLNGSPGPTSTVTANFILLPDPPVVTTTGHSAGLADHLRTLEGTVNPNDFAVGGCRFEYGPSTKYGQSSPCVPGAGELGEGNAAIPVSAETEALEPETTYHFRLRATNLGGIGLGEDRTFTTGPAPTDDCPNAGIRAAQGIGTLLLPDCMALEQVSPSKKGNQHARLPSLISADGGRLRFNSFASIGEFANTGGLSGDLYLAVRGPSAWAPEALNAPLGSEGGSSHSSFAPDLSRWFSNGSVSIEGTFFPVYYQRGLGGAVSRISPPLKKLSGPTGNATSFQGASADHSHLYFEPTENPRNSTYLPGDPQPSGVGEDHNLYVAQLDDAGQPSLELLARDRDGKAWGGNCGARLGGIEPNSGSDLYLRNGSRNQGAISPDGSRVYFSTRPGQPETGDCVPASKMRIMVREETPIGPKIEELFQSECDRVSPPCATHAGDDVYQGASVDQTRVYFNTNRQLADTDLDGDATSCSNGTGNEDGDEPPVPGCDLYLYDSELPAGERLIQVSAGDETAATPGEGAKVQNSITAISADGSHVYFVAQSVLTEDENPEGEQAQAGQNNLYAYTHPEGEIAFVGTLDVDDGSTGGFVKGVIGVFGGSQNWANRAYAVPIKGSDAEGKEVGGDGHVLLFRVKAALTADDQDDSSGSALRFEGRDIYRYDAEAETLELISKAAPGGSDDGPFDVDIGQSGGIGTDYAERGWAGGEGETVVFTTVEPLLPGDVNGAEDAFMWRRGVLTRLPGATAVPNGPSIKPIVSADGSTVAFGSSSKLTPSDGDSAFDVYAARVDGGYPHVDPPICIPDGDGACQGALQGAPPSASAASASFAGKGNVKGKAKKAKKRCRKGKRKVRRKGKVRCVRRASRKKQGRHERRRAAGRNQGGQK